MKRQTKYLGIIVLLIAVACSVVSTKLAGSSPPLNETERRLAGSSPPLNERESSRDSTRAQQTTPAAAAPALEGCLKCHEQIEPMHKFGPTTTLEKLDH